MRNTGSKIRRLVAADTALVAELEDGRMFQLPAGKTTGWMLLPEFPESDKEREDRELKERAEAIGLHTGDEK